MAHGSRCHLPCGAMGSCEAKPGMAADGDGRWQERYLVIHDAWRCGEWGITVKAELSGGQIMRPPGGLSRQRCRERPMTPGQNR